MGIRKSLRIKELDSELRDAVKYLEEIEYENDEQFIAQIRKLVDIDVDIYNEKGIFEVYDLEMDANIYLKIKPSKAEDVDNTVEIIKIRGN